MKSARFPLILVLTAGLPACVPFPVYKTLQPAAKITVLDDRRAPVEAATVMLMAGSYPYVSKDVDRPRPRTRTAWPYSKDAVSCGSKASCLTALRSFSGAGVFRSRASRPISPIAGQ